MKKLIALSVLILVLPATVVTSMEAERDLEVLQAPAAVLVELL